jgi:hypothetical protein
VPLYGHDPRGRAKVPAYFAPANSGARFDRIPRPQGSPRFRQGIGGDSSKESYMAPGDV